MPPSPSSVHVPLLSPRQLQSMRPWTSAPSGTYSEPELSRDGRKLAVILDNTQLLLLDVKTERVESTIKLERGSLVRPVFTPEGKLCAIGADWIGDVWVADVE